VIDGQDTSVITAAVPTSPIVAMFMRRSRMMYLVRTSGPSAGIGSWSGDFTSEKEAGGEKVGSVWGAAFFLTLFFFFFDDDEEEEMAGVMVVVGLGVWDEEEEEFVFSVTHEGASDAILSNKLFHVCQVWTM